jgi:signal transduction histidine kinase
VREVARSEPTFRRRLLFASALFTTLCVADLFLVANLAFRDLSHRVIDQAFRASLRSLETPAPVPLTGDAADGSDAPPLLPPSERCPPADPQTSARVWPCTGPTPEPTPGLRVFSTLSRHRVFVDTQGRVIGREFRQETRLGIGGPAGAPVMPGHREVSEEWDLGGRRRPVIALAHQASPGSNEIKEIGIPSDLIEEQVAQIQRDLQMKLWLGAGVAVLILLIAFLYVLRLLHRTRLQEAQAQMDDRLAHLGALAAGLAHEIRNPLNVLSMNLQMLEEEITGRPGGDVGDARLYLGALQGEIRRLSGLVNNFLAYARPNQPRFETKDLNRILRDVCLLVRPEFERRGLSLREDLASFLPPVDLDESLIRQALMNVLINATQVLKTGGLVTVRSRVGPQGEAIVTIEDDGPGIKPEDQARIFEVFYSTRGGGTGLGLPIAAKILEAHGGSIAVESEPGRGARFILRLPRRHAAEAAPAPAAAAAAPERS